MLVKDDEIILKNGRKAVVRPLGRRDINEMIEFDSKIIHESDYIIFDDYSSVDEKRKEHEYYSLVLNYVMAKLSLLLGVFIEDKLVAQGYFGPVNDTEHRSSIEIVVLKEYQNNGIATYLLNHLIRIAKSKGVEQMEANVVTLNEFGIRLCRRAGFKDIAIIPHALKLEDNKYYDSYYFIKDLL